MTFFLNLRYIKLYRKTISFPRPRGPHMRGCPLVSGDHTSKWSPPHQTLPCGLHPASSRVGLHTGCDQEQCCSHWSWLPSNHYTPFIPVGVLLIEPDRIVSSCIKLHRAASSCIELHRAASSCIELHRAASSCIQLHPAASA